MIYKYLVCLLMVCSLSMTTVLGMESSSSDSGAIYETEDNLFEFDFEQMGIVPTETTDDRVTYRIRDKSILERFKEVSSTQYREDEELVELIFHQPTNSLSVSSQISPEWCKGLFVKKVGRISFKSGNTVLRSNSMTGDGVVSVQIQRGIQAGYNSTVSVSASVVTAGVGFNVTKLYNITDVGSANSKKGYETTITAYPRYLIQPFEVWDDGCVYDTKEGSGQAREPIGVYFQVTQRKIK